MDGLLLYGLDLQGFQLLIEDLAQIHDDALVNLLPQMCTEDLDQRDLECGNFAVHEDTRQVKLDLETDVDWKDGLPKRAEKLADIRDAVDSPKWQRDLPFERLIVVLHQSVNLCGENQRNSRQGVYVKSQRRWRIVAGKKDPGRWTIPD